MSEDNEQFAPSRLAEIVRNRLAQSTGEVSGYWFQVLGDRDQYATELRAHIRDLPIAVLIVRGFSFDNPNAVLTEFVKLIQDSREICEKQLALDNSPDGRFGIVLLTRNALRIPQISSPVILPDWFPRLGGKTTSLILQDVTWNGEAALDCSEASIAELSRLLFGLDGTLLTRLSAVHRQSIDLTNSLWSQLRGDDNTYQLSEFLSAAKESRGKVRNPGKFRPSTTGARFITGMVWRTMQRTHTERIGKLAGALAKGLQLPDPLGLPWHQTMVSILARPANPAPSESAQFASNVLVTVASSAQFLTAAAHADAYGSYPVPLLRSLSYDFRAGLANAAAVLSALDPVVGDR